MKHLEQLPGLTVYPRSTVQAAGATFFLARGPQGKCLGILGDAAGFQGALVGAPGDKSILFPLTPANAAVLRNRLPWLKPRPLGLERSMGFGDRLGLATPGHVQALRRPESGGAQAGVGGAGGIAPVFAQQSVRENLRTGRTPQQVLDDATWGLFQEGWREGWGADADHLKTPEAMDAFIKAGFTLYTIDPSDHVDGGAHAASAEVLEDKVRALPWDELEDAPDGVQGRYLGRRFEVGESVLTFDRLTLERAAVKYGRALLHTARLYRHLAGRLPPGEFELEVSVDETEAPTSPEEHFFFASELARLGVRWVSLAPRFPGRFEKGVDYTGDLVWFEEEFGRHAAVARRLGPYKLSIHSGSDKFSIYPIVARLAGGLVHLKTSGTSYLEALRAIARVEPGLFREILAFACRRYDEDRVGYHVSADPGRVPPPGGLADGQLEGVLALSDGREVLHVTFGSVLERFGGRLKSVLSEREDVHHAALEAHLGKHLAPFRR